VGAGFSFFREPVVSSLRRETPKSRERHRPEPPAERQRERSNGRHGAKDGGWSGKKQLCNFATQDSFNYVLPMPTKFDVWMGEKHLTFFYSSGNTEPLTAQKVRICQILGISPQLARFSVSHETIDAARLSATPAFESEGTKFWLP
jgi:hypothetical protein